MARIACILVKTVALYVFSFQLVIKKPKDVTVHKIYNMMSCETEKQYRLTKYIGS